jgi:hypothetical protein
LFQCLSRLLDSFSVDQGCTQSGEALTQFPDRDRFRALGDELEASLGRLCSRSLNLAAVAAEFGVSVPWP